MLIDLTGVVFGRLTVLDRAPNQGSSTMWRCQCQCGNAATVNGASLRRRFTRSCGCLMAEARFGTKWRISHGDTRKCARSPTYLSWSAMLRRCRNPNAPDYNLYGGRGISVCERWLGYEAFRHDMGERPTGKTLDRIDPCGNYEPRNCRWSTRVEQINNRRNTKMLEVNGITKPLTEWSRDLGVGVSTIRERLKRGWLPQDAASVAPLKKGSVKLYGKGQRYPQPIPLNRRASIDRHSE